MVRSNIGTIRFFLVPLTLHICADFRAAYVYQSNGDGELKGTPKKQCYNNRMNRKKLHNKGGLTDTSLVSRVSVLQLYPVFALPSLGHTTFQDA